MQSVIYETMICGLLPLEEAGGVCVCVCALTLHGMALTCYPLKPLTAAGAGRGGRLLGDPQIESSPLQRETFPAGSKNDGF